MELVKAPVAVTAPCEVLVANAVVGLMAVSQATPYWVGLGEPKAVILPLPVAVVAVMAVTACVVTVGAVPVVKVKRPVPVAAPTITSTRPTAWAGVTAVIVVVELTTTEVAATPPKVTAGVPEKLVPVMTTGVPPKVEPLLGETPVTVGVSPIVATFRMPVVGENQVLFVFVAAEVVDPHVPVTWLTPPNQSEFTGMVRPALISASAVPMIDRLAPTEVPVFMVLFPLPERVKLLYVTAPTVCMSLLL